jgi:DNA-nicking Smr family endonuclease
MAAAKHALGDLKKLVTEAAQKSKSAPAAPISAVAVSTRARMMDHPDFAQTFAPLKRDLFITDSDRRLFAKAVEGTTKLRERAPSPIKPKKPLPIPRQTMADETAALHQANEAVTPSPMSWDLGVDLEEDQSYLRSGANPDLLRKLRRGMWVTQGELDLHHHTQEEAHTALSEFLALAKQREWRCVRIIHGKGIGSHRKEPVLRGKVRRWLQMRADIVAFCEPRPNGGGSGAVLVLLDGNA